MRKYNIGVNLVRAIEHMHDKATSAVLMNGSLGEWFRTTIGVRQGCLLSPTLYNTFLERIMTDALEDHVGLICKPLVQTRKVVLSRGWLVGHNTPNNIFVFDTACCICCENFTVSFIIYLQLWNLLLKLFTSLHETVADCFGGSMP